MAHQNIPFKIKDSIALVTGANRGLGATFVDVLIKRGAKHIYAGARNFETLQPLMDQHGSKVTPLTLDVTNQAQVDDAVTKAGDVTFLINNAGILGGKGLMGAGSLETLTHEMDVNVYGLARMSLAFAPVLKNNDISAILNTLSAASLYPYAPLGSYGATKACAMSLTQSMAYELRDQGTQVFGMYAGFVDTDMIKHIEGVKTSPHTIVSRTLDGIEAGISDIDADERSAKVRKLRNDDGEAVKESFWARADQPTDTYEQ